MAVEEHFSQVQGIMLYFLLETAVNILNKVPFRFHLSFLI